MSPHGAREALPKADQSLVCWREAWLQTACVITAAYKYRKRQLTEGCTQGVPDDVLVYLSQTRPIATAAPVEIEPVVLARAQLVAHGPQC